MNKSFAQNFLTTAIIAASVSYAQLICPLSGIQRIAICQDDGSRCADVLNSGRLQVHISD